MKLGLLSYGVLLMTALCVACSNDVDKTDKEPNKSETGAVVNNPVVLARQILDVSKPEARYLEDAHCLNESECYGPRRFAADIFKRYPDLRGQVKKIKQTNPAIEQFDQDQFLNVIVGLYFAKQITLANGQSLYDFMTQCSASWDDNNRAEFAYDSKTQQSYFSLQFFPRLRNVVDGRFVELNLIFDRRGNQVISNSVGLSNASLTNPDFLTGGGLGCANQPSTSGNTDSSTTKANASDIKLVQSVFKEIRDIEDLASDQQKKLNNELISLVKNKQKRTFEKTDVLRELFENVNVTLDKSSRITTPNLANADAMRYMTDAINAHKKWALIQQTKFKLFTHGDMDGATKMAEQADRFAEKEALSMAMAFKAVGAPLP